MLLTHRFAQMGMVAYGLVRTGSGDQLEVFLDYTTVHKPKMDYQLDIVGIVAQGSRL